MSGNGWISLHRSLQNHWLFTEKRKFSKFEAWVDLLLLVNHSDSKEIFRDELVSVKRGQRVTSIRKLCNRWGWSNNKVKNFFDLLEAEHMAIIQSDTKKSLVTVINYDFYQKDNSKKRHPENQNEQKEPQKSDSDATVLNQEYQEVSQLEENKKRQQCDSDATAMHTNNNVNNENNLNKLTNNNNESPKSFLEELEEDEAKQASNMKLIEEIEREYQARKGEDPELPPHDNDIRSITNMVNENKFTREEIFDGINYAFLTAAKQNNTVFSFNYCITSIISQKEYKQKQKEWNQLKQQKKTSNNTPDSKLPIAIREQMEREERERQGIKEPEPSPEEVSKQRAKLKEMLEDMGIHREDLA